MSIASNPVSYAVEKIMSISVDKTLLQLCYGGINSIGLRKNIAIELDKTIAKHVCGDFNLISGEVIDIPIAKCKLINNSEGRVYIVPPEARRNRDIREVLSLRKKVITGRLDQEVYSMDTSGSSILNGLVSMGNAMTDSEPTGTTMVELEDDNTIRVTTSNGSLYGYDTFVVDIENRDRLRRLKRGSYPLFAKIATAFVRSEIYANRLSISRAAIHGGHELSEVSSAISEFSGALEEYESYISDNAGKMLLFSDESKLNSLYQYMV